MDWNYLAGFVDGEGCIGLYIYKQRNYSRVHNKYSVKPKIQITSASRLMKENITNFLKSENIKSTLYKIKIQVNSWKSVEEFCKKIYPYSILKKREIELLLKACNIYNSLPNACNGKQIEKNYKLFIPIAKELRSLKSDKGKTRDKSKYSLI